MKRRDTSSNVTVFFFLGFSDLPFTVQASLFTFLLLLTYLFAVFGNGLIILAIALTPQLHAPMYGLLQILSLTELLLISSVVPKALQSCFWLDTITIVGCAAQYAVFIASAAVECSLLVVMSIDRFMAICHPLRYASVMTFKLCYKANIICLFFAIVNGSVLGYLMTTLWYCRTHIISHYFCEVTSLISIACGSTFVIDVYQLFMTGPPTVIPTLMIFYSYSRILYSVFVLHSADARQKAFSTCSSHLLSVILFFGSAMAVHLRLGSHYSPYEDRMMALSYCAIIPTINPLIYSLKNKEIKDAIRKVPVRIIDLKNTYS